MRKRIAKTAVKKIAAIRALNLTASGYDHDSWGKPGHFFCSTDALLDDVLAGKRGELWGNGDGTYHIYIHSNMGYYLAPLGHTVHSLAQINADNKAAEEDRYNARQVVVQGEIRDIRDALTKIDEGHRPIYNAGDGVYSVEMPGRDWVGTVAELIARAAALKPTAEPDKIPNVCAMRGGALTIKRWRTVALKVAQGVKTRRAAAVPLSPAPMPTPTPPAPTLPTRRCRKLGRPLGRMNLSVLRRAPASTGPLDAASIPEVPAPTGPIDAKAKTILGVTFAPSDLPFDTARDAYRWSSFTPERRAEQEQAGYFRHLCAVGADLMAAAGEKEALAAEMFSSYRAGYLQRLISKLGSDSRCASTMITGGSNFPARRNEKRLAAAHRKLDDLIEWSNTRQRRMVASLRREAPKDAQGRADSLQGRLDERERRQEYMRRANKAVRSKDPRASLAAAGFTPAEIEQIMTPNCFNIIGFADFELRNNGAEIRRLRARLEEEKRDAEKAVQQNETEYMLGGVRVEEDINDDRLRLHFDGKPNDEMRRALKGRGFRWSPTQGAWQRQLTQAARAAARSILSA